MFLYVVWESSLAIINLSDNDDDDDDDYEFLWGLPTKSLVSSVDHSQSSHHC